jgi:hypothetical protein
VFTFTYKLNEVAVGWATAHVAAEPGHDAYVHVADEHTSADLTTSYHW